MIGTRLGPYQITAQLGAGGMGEVYRAHDTKLDREVAIKVLPERLAADAEALARFEREAKAVAALSHPNILAIFDFGRAEPSAATLHRSRDWSPKGDLIVFQTTRGGSSLAAIRPDGGGWQRVPTGRGLATPRWSPDGSTISVYDYNRGGGLLFDVSAGLGAPVERELPAVADGLLFWPTAWSPDGALLAGRASRAGQIEDIVVRRNATGEYRTLPRTAGAREDFNMTFVDGRHLLYTDDTALWLIDALGGEARRVYTPPSGRRPGNPSASRDGRWLTWIERADESDIWLMTLEAAAETDRAARSSP